MADWYYSDRGKKLGPISLQQIREKLVSDEFGRSTLVWNMGLEEWTTISACAELQGILSEVPPTLPYDTVGSGQFHADENGTVPCPFCSEPVIEDATLCKSCGSSLLDWQKWRSEQIEWERTHKEEAERERRAKAELEWRSTPEGLLDYLLNSDLADLNPYELLLMVQRRDISPERGAQAFQRLQDQFGQYREAYLAKRLMAGDTIELPIPDSIPSNRPARKSSPTQGAEAAAGRPELGQQGNVPVSSSGKGDTDVRQENTSISRNLFEDFEVAIGPNGKWYLSKFRKFDQLGSGYHLSWNWPAFFVPFLWAVYRKMYGVAGGLVVASVLCSLPEALSSNSTPASAYGIGSVISGILYLIVYIGFAAAANSIFFNKVKLIVGGCQRRFESGDARKDCLVRHGGTNPWGVFWLLLVLMSILGAVVAMFAGYISQ
jgi:hypothetical protein